MSVVLGFAILAVSCGEDEPEITMAERLADVEGRELSAEELADRVAVGNTLCGMDDAVLDAIWRQLNERQLNYQDVVFGHICPDRSILYASRTGRYVTEEATESGVVPSTTRPPLTTVAPSTTTTAAPAATEPADPNPTDDSTTVDDDGTDSSAATTTTPAAAEPTTTEAATTSTTAAATTQPTISSLTTVVGEGG